MERVSLKKIAYARSGDKGEDVNIGLIARTSGDYQILVEKVTEERVLAYFRPLGTKRVRRFLLPTLGALNFVLEGALPGGAMRNLRIDSQGKAFGQALLDMEV